MTETRHSSQVTQPSPTKRRLLRPLLIMIGMVVLIVAIIAATKFVQISKIIAQAEAPQPPAVVTAMPVQFSSWQPSVSAIGSMKAFRGVDVTTEVGGIVQTVAFKSGQDVTAGAILLQLNADSDIAQLRSLEASADLAAIVLKRDRAQLKENAISQAQVDADEGDWKSKTAIVQQQRALIAKKSIVAPFVGRIGITTINPGQYLSPGDKIATLTTLDPILINFSVPQAQKAQITVGQSVTISSDGLEGHSFQGKVSAIDTKVDQATRNVLVEASIPNPKNELLPGMFARAVVSSGQQQQMLTVPQTAITVNPYGTTAFVAVKSEGANNTDALTAQQIFVQTGPTRGDQIAIISGLNEGDMVVTSGQMKLKNGTHLRIDNSTSPANDPSPTPQEK
ncbi:efflux RND transporter periplasmic adaptor subunit [Pectobacterium brasiliense]|uniref:efflux RND transporter periplasmic adaptor subunit n=1 Tax=Pectobacterium brasiliense TaxID=180957 RepID=UPI00196948A2|nr:efflux RND transporter periplasmic adaptor subunit [Pectobacterium brasiliense]MBN3229317.1 efflux RND transporter periplasmic adaptor subunit [Pectobacterium brasiliense]